jgi:hypothetical protein
VLSLDALIVTRQPREEYYAELGARLRRVVPSDAAAAAARSPFEYAS